jgi:hypothetical protein
VRGSMARQYRAKPRISSNLLAWYRRVHPVGWVAQLRAMFKRSGAPGATSSAKRANRRSCCPSILSAYPNLRRCWRYLIARSVVLSMLKRPWADQRAERGQVRLNIGIGAPEIAMTQEIGDLLGIGSVAEEPGRK